MVVSIIVLLILVGVAINTLAGENGLINKAIDSKERTEISGIEEELQTAIEALKIDWHQLGAQGTVGGYLSDHASDFKIAVGDDNLAINDNKITYKGRTFVVDMQTGRIIGRTIATSESIMSATQSGVGYYIKKGDEYAIIFADRLAQAKTTEDTTITWSYTNDSSCTFPQLTGNENFKSYVISDEEYEDPRTTSDSSKGFGKNKVIKVADGNVGTEDRFMALSLTDFITSDYTSFFWYYGADMYTDFNATGGNDGKGYPTSKAFWKGKVNTETMINKWNTKAYRAETTSENNQDLWKNIQSKTIAGWFVPSFEEWSAFCYAMANNKFKGNNFGALGLNLFFWSSSLKSSTDVWGPYFVPGYMDGMSLVSNFGYSVRLATTY